MAWHRICKLADLDPEDVTPFAAGGVALAVCLVEGQPHAFSDICTHEAVALTGGFLEGAQIECPLHGARFCVRTGRCLSPPATEDLAIYPTRVDAGELYVQVGED